MSVISSYRDLSVWRRSMELAEMIYAPTKGFPKSEEYRMTSQLVRAAISIPANIAEGNARNSREDYARFISIARGSSAELSTLLMLSKRVGLSTGGATDDALALCEEVGRMLAGLHQKLAAR